jgi:hypothetical protein
MTWTRRGAALAAATGGALVAGRAIATRRNRQWRTAPGGWANDSTRWHAVTVLVGLDEAMPDGRPPDPLAALGDDLEVRMRPAPGDRGTELAARPLGGDVGRVRRALRETKSLLETGEVLLPDAPPTTERTLLNRPLEHVTRHAREEGTL